MANIDESILHAIYGEGSEGQISRYEGAVETFQAIYGPGDIFIFRAPSRVNLIGEHTDYNHGFVMPVALDKDILLLARPRKDNVVSLTNVEATYSPLTFSIEPAIPIGPAGSWENYAKGAAQLLSQRLGRPLAGIDGLIVGAQPYGVPRGAGLSSSTSLTVVVSLALAHFNEWQPPATALAQFCSQAEWYVGTRGGVLDQFSLLLTQQSHALFLDCRPDDSGRFDMVQVPLPPGYGLMVANSGVHHRNVGGGYNQRVAACRAGVALLRSHYPDITHLRDVQQVPWSTLAEHLPAETSIAELESRQIDLGDVPGVTPTTRLRVQARCRHVWTENERVKSAVTALRNGDISTLGILLNDAHASARDDYEISCPELESLVAAAVAVDGVVGARLTGAGWGGCIVALVSKEAVPHFQSQVSQRYRAETGLDTTIFSCRAGPGAGLVMLT